MTTTGPTRTILHTHTRAYTCVHVRTCTFTYVYVPYIQNYRQKNIFTMNLFFIDHWLEKCANSACDKHVIKMILETAQVLYTAWHCRAELPPSELKPYRMTHVNHPTAIWVRDCEENYMYACYYGLLLCAEYTQRYGKYHKTEQHLRQLYMWGYPPCQKCPPPVKKGKQTAYAFFDVPHGIKKIPLCMPEEYHIRDEHGNLLGVESYRNYYRSKQNNFKMVWKQNQPQWF